MDTNELLENKLGDTMSVLRQCMKWLLDILVWMG